MPALVGDLFEGHSSEDIYYFFDDTSNSFFIFVNKSNKFALHTYSRDPLVLRYPFARALTLVKPHAPLSVVTPMGVIVFSISECSTNLKEGQTPSTIIEVKIKDIPIELLTQCYKVSEDDAIRILQNRDLLSRFKNYCVEILTRRLGLVKENIVIVASDEEL
jgi:hypothetical protein